MRRTVRIYRAEKLGRLRVRGRVTTRELAAEANRRDLQPQLREFPPEPRPGGIARLGERLVPADAEPRLGPRPRRGCSPRAPMLFRGRNSARRRLFSSSETSAPSSRSAVNEGRSGVPRSAQFAQNDALVPARTTPTFERSKLAARARKPVPEWIALTATARACAREHIGRACRYRRNAGRVFWLVIRAWPGDGKYASSSGFQPLGHAALRLGAGRARARRARRPRARRRGTRRPTPGRDLRHADTANGTLRADALCRSTAS